MIEENYIVTGAYYIFQNVLPIYMAGAPVFSSFHDVRDIT